MRRITAEGDGEEVEEKAEEQQHGDEYLVKEEHVSPLHSFLGVSLCCLVPVLGKEIQY